MRQAIFIAIFCFGVSFAAPRILDNSSSSESSDYYPYPDYETPHQNSVPNISAAPADTYTSRQDNEWRRNAVDTLSKHRIKMGHTPLKNITVKGAKIFLKDEASSASESLKHRFAWALVMWAVLRGSIRQDTIVYEASSGNTAASEAYMCGRINVTFKTYVPEATDLAKIQRIQHFNGSVVPVPKGQNIEETAKAAAKNDTDHGLDAFFMNQFGNADAAEEYHYGGKNGLESSNVYYEILTQLGMKSLKSLSDRSNSDIPPVDYFVHTAGTGGTLSSVGKLIKTYNISTEVVLADTEYSIYYDMVIHQRFTNKSQNASEQSNGHPGISGTGSSAVVNFGVFGETTSLLPSVIDRVVKIPDLASIAATHVLFYRHNIYAGPSTGVSFLTILHLISTHKKKPEDEQRQLVLATILSDPGSNYCHSYYNATWIEESFKNYGGLEEFKCWKTIIDEYVQDDSKVNSESPLLKGHRECSSKPKWSSPLPNSPIRVPSSSVKAPK